MQVEGTHVSGHVISTCHVGIWCYQAGQGGLRCVLLYCCANAAEINLEQLIHVCAHVMRPCEACWLFAHMRKGTTCSPHDMTCFCCMLCMQVECIFAGGLRVCSLSVCVRRQHVGPTGAHSGSGVPGNCSRRAEEEQGRPARAAAC